MTRFTAVFAQWWLNFGFVLSQQYQLLQNYNSSNFFEEFRFFADTDPAGGFVEYVPFQTALTTGIVSNETGLVYLGVDRTNKYTPNDKGRPSVRLESKMTFTEGLFVIDLTHIPVGCGTWPAFWTAGLGDWGRDGEIDIIENVNNARSNDAALHTAGACTVLGSTAQTGQWKSTDCNTEHDGNQGCGTTFTEPYNYGAEFNANGGGVYAMEWGNDSINIWFFTQDKVPSSLRDDRTIPNTKLFGTPSASFAGPCSSSFGEKFFNHTIIINTSFCGGWAGGTFGHGTSACPLLEGSTPTESCVDYVARNPEAFTEAWWGINSVKVWGKVYGIVPQDGVNPTAAEESPESTPLSVSPLTGGVLNVGNNKVWHETKQATQTPRPTRKSKSALNSLKSSKHQILSTRRYTKQAPSAYSGEFSTTESPESVPTSSSSSDKILKSSAIPYSTSASQYDVSSPDPSSDIEGLVNGAQVPGAVGSLYEDATIVTNPTVAEESESDSSPNYAYATASNNSTLSNSVGLGGSYTTPSVESVDTTGSDSGTVSAYTNEPPPKSPLTQDASSNFVPNDIDTGNAAPILNSTSSAIWKALGDEIQDQLLALASGLSGAPASIPTTPLVGTEEPKLPANDLIPVGALSGGLTGAPAAVPVIPILDSQGPQVPTVDSTPVAALDKTDTSQAIGALLAFLDETAKQQVADLADLPIQGVTGGDTTNTYGSSGNVQEKRHFDSSIRQRERTSSNGRKDLNGTELSIICPNLSFDSSAFDSFLTDLKNPEAVPEIIIARFRNDLEAQSAKLQECIWNLNKYVKTLEPSDSELHTRQEPSGLTGNTELDKYLYEEGNFKLGKWRYGILSKEEREDLKKAIQKNPIGNEHYPQPLLPAGAINNANDESSTDNGPAKVVIYPSSTSTATKLPDTTASPRNQILNLLEIMSKIASNIADADLKLASDHAAQTYPNESLKDNVLDYLTYLKRDIADFEELVFGKYTTTGNSPSRSTRKHAREFHHPKDKPVAANHKKVDSASSILVEVLGKQGTLDPYGMLGPQIPSDSNEVATHNTIKPLPNESEETKTGDFNELDDSSEDNPSPELENIPPLDPFGQRGPQVPDTEQDFDEDSPITTKHTSPKASKQDLDDSSETQITPELQNLPELDPFGQKGPQINGTDDEESESSHSFDELDATSEDPLSPELADLPTLDPFGELGVRVPGESDEDFDRSSTYEDDDDILEMIEEGVRGVTGGLSPASEIDDDDDLSIWDNFMNDLELLFLAAGEENEQSGSDIPAHADENADMWEE